MDFKEASTERKPKEPTGEKVTPAAPAKDAKAAEQRRYYEDRTSERERERTRSYYAEEKIAASYGADGLHHQDSKQSTEEDTGALRPVVADALRSVDFDETHYLSPEMLIQTLYWDSNPSNDRGLRACIAELYREEKQAAASEQELEAAAMDLIERRSRDILGRCLEVREYVTETGNCGGMANFLLEKREEETAEHSNFDAFITELRQNVRADTVKLISVQANIGHAFTLICYEQAGETVVELIQAWQGEYSVKKSLDGSGREIYTNQELADMFCVMHRGLTQKRGRQLYDAVFLGAKLKGGIDQLEIDRMIVKTINEMPESYAGRMAAKGTDGR